MADNPILGMTPAQMLAVHDGFMSGKRLSDEEKLQADHVFTAAAFGAEAFDKAAAHGLTADGAPVALLRAFLLALVDPLHADLDYLRADPASGAVERAKREEVNG